MLTHNQPCNDKADDQFLLPQTAMPFPPITHFMPLLGIDIKKPKMNMSVYIIFRLFEIDNIFLPTLFQRGCYPLE